MSPEGLLHSIAFEDEGQGLQPGSSSTPDANAARPVLEGANYGRGVGATCRKFRKKAFVVRSMAEQHDKRASGAEMHRVGLGWVDLDLSVVTKLSPAVPWTV
jgi:hypothetical protein